jgi:hypothetical protein
VSERDTIAWHVHMQDLMHSGMHFSLQLAVCACSAPHGRPAPNPTAMASALLTQSLRSGAACKCIRSSAAMANAWSGVERPRAVCHGRSRNRLQVCRSCRYHAVLYACYRASSSVTPSGPAQLCATISLLSSAPTTTARPHRGGWAHVNTGAYPSSIRRSPLAPFIITYAVTQLHFNTQLTQAPPKELSNAHEANCKLWLCTQIEAERRSGGCPTKGFHRLCSGSRSPYRDGSEWATSRRSSRSSQCFLSVP